MKLTVELRLRKLLSMVIFMTLEVLAKAEDWSLFNSSLLIEVTKSSGVFTCTGVAITPEIVLTAAHCLEGDVKKVRVFTQKIYDPELPSREIKSFKLHPNYNPVKSRYQADLGKIILKDKLPTWINVHPIYKGGHINGSILRFGFGARNNRNIRTVVIPSLRKIDIEESVLELDDKYSRSGDSGGPIFIRNGKEITLLAIHSTFSFGPEGEYSLNPTVAGYLNWVFEN